jgi:phosphotransferase system HPr (HPr) family protein
LSETQIARREFTIRNKLGIHARPAAQFVKTASRFSCEIAVEKDGEQVDGKSIMGLMMLAAGHGSILIVSADGEDAEEALSAIEGLVNRNFEES